MEFLQHVKILPSLLTSLHFDGLQNIYFIFRYHGTTRNPYNPHHFPGGSSNGSAAAVAAGKASIADENIENGVEKPSQITTTFQVFVQIRRVGKNDGENNFIQWDFLLIPLLFRPLSTGYWYRWRWFCEDPSFFLWCCGTER